MGVQESTNFATWLASYLAAKLIIIYMQAYGGDYLSGMHLHTGFPPQKTSVLL